MRGSSLPRRRSLPRPVRRMEVDAPNRDQADANRNMIGDVCEAMGAPDADRDGRPDSADNCPMVWNVNQADEDRDGIGNVCGPTPRGEPPLPWNNGVLSRALVAWKDEIQCSLNGCRNPGGPGSWSRMCDNDGAVDWNVSLSGVRAISRFTYRNCENSVTIPVHDDMRDPRNVDPTATRPMEITLTATGIFTQDTDFSGNGRETGMVNVTGSFTGTIVSHVQIRGAQRAPGSYFSVSCSMDPIEQEMCARKSPGETSLSRLGLRACDMASSSQHWSLERYDQGGFDMQFPLRLRSAQHNYCLYTDRTNDVYASQGNCSLAGTENGRKVGIYANGDFMMTPTQP
jgi:hypothetical protein